MAINIQSLFADIIDTPEQRKQKMLEQGMLEGRALASGLRGRAAALAPLAQVAGQLGVQRRADLASAVQPLMGIDTRTAGEKVMERVGQLDLTDPTDMLKAARELQAIDPVRAASLRQAAAERQVEIADRKRKMERENAADRLAAAREQRAKNQEARAVTNWAQDMVTDALTRRREEEEINRAKALKTRVSSLVRESDTELADSILDSDLTSVQLINLQKEITQDPDIKVSQVEMTGEELVSRGYEVPNIDASYNVFVRTNQGLNPDENEKDRIGSIVADSIFTQRPSARVRNMSEDTRKQLQDLVASDRRFDLINAPTDKLVTDIYQYEEKFNADRERAVSVALEDRYNDSFANPINFEANKDFVANPSAFLPNITPDILRAYDLRANDDLQFQVLTKKNIEENELQANPGDVIMTYPVKVRGREVLENNQIKRARLLIPSR